MENHNRHNRRVNQEARLLFRYAQERFVEGDHRGSIAAFTEFIDMRGESEIALLSRGVAYLKANDPVRAGEDFSRAIDINDTNIRAFFYRGMASLSENDFHRAVSDFDRAIDLKPDHGAAYFARGSAYAQMGNEFEAARNIKKALSCSEAGYQGLLDTYGVIRTEFDKAMMVFSDQDKAPAMVLTEDEIELVRKWLDEPYDSGNHDV